MEIHLQRCCAVHCNGRGGVCHVRSNTLFKAATLGGLSFYVFVFYNYVIATLVLLPLYLIFGRSRKLSSAKSPVFFKIFLLPLVRFMSVIACCKGIEYSSQTLASAISNLTPTFTFTLAVIFRFLGIATATESPATFPYSIQRIFLQTSDPMARGAEEETVVLRYFNRDVVPFAAMVAVECVTVGSTTLYKAATLRGLSFYVFVFYVYLVATLVLLPLSLIFGRSRRLPSPKSHVFFKIFLLALLGFMSMIAACKGVEYSSPTLATAIGTLTPAYTFTLAVIFRMEKVVLRSSATQAKIIGTIVSISGALVVVLYKGPKVLAAGSLTSSNDISLYHHLTSFDSSWIIGGLLLASQYFLISVWYILQTQVMEVYPEEIIVVFLYNLCGTLISAPVCLLAEKDLTSFLLKPSVSLASVMYSGGLVSSLGTVIHTWGLHLKGPVYISLFKPLSIVIAVAMGAIFLGDALHLGSVIGSVILSLGFYTVIWGKAREDSTKSVAVSEQSPLLLTHIIEDASGTF